MYNKFHSYNLLSFYYPLSYEVGELVSFLLSVSTKFSGELREGTDISQSLKLIDHH